MKVFATSLTRPELEVNAYVERLEECITILDALRIRWIEHDVIFRVRIKRGKMHEARYIGTAKGARDFIRDLTVVLSNL